MRVVCHCDCHNEARALQRIMLARWSFDRAYAYAQAAKQHTGADVTDPLEAAVSCEGCRKSHCPALKTRIIWSPDTPENAAFVEPPTPANFCNDDDGN